MELKVIQGTSSVQSKSFFNYEQVISKMFCNILIIKVLFDHKHSLWAYNTFSLQLKTVSNSYWETNHNLI